MKLQLAILREAKPIILRIADREAPDQKPKISHNKKKKNKKRRRKRKNVEKLNQDVSPPTSDSSDAPLLRHEHTHTHLHYITSPSERKNQ